jgi:hypothetical protein
VSGQRPLVELRPGPLSNKGGELMLVAMVRELGSDFRLAAEPWIGSYERRASLGLYQKVGFRRRFDSAARLASLLPRRLRDGFGLVTESDVSAVLDASGFAYGDQHGPDRARRMAGRAARLKKQGKKVVLMPQALGPFEDQRVATQARRLFGLADLVYARDEESEGHARRLLGDAPNLRRAPDFTIPLAGELPPSFDAGGRYACLVPNWRMQQSTAAAIGASYVPFLDACVRLLEARGLRVLVVIHEAAGDREVAHQLASAVGHELHIVDEPDPLKLKGILGHSWLVVGSRFHALVGALSSAVPAIGTGWSHKYEALFADFGCPELLLSPDTTTADLEQTIDGVLDPQTRQSLSARLAEHATRLGAQVNEMWRDVRGVLAAR